MKRNYHNSLNRDIAKALDRSEGSIARRAWILGLKKDKEFIIDCSRATQFKKGIIPANKGKKMPYNPNSARTQFKKGIIPHNTFAVGSQVLDPEGYLKRKVADRKDIPSRKNWQYVHRILWEQHNGKIPEKHIIIFRNGDRSDIRIENLECISMAENAKRNRERYPAEILQISQLIGAINRKIRRKEKENHGQQH